MNKLKILLDEPTAIESLNLRSLEAGKVVSCFGFDSLEREVWESAAKSAYKSYLHLRSIGIKHQYAATILPLATVYRRGKRRPEWALQANPVCIRRLPRSDDSFIAGLGI